MNLESQWITGFVDGEGCFHVQILSNSSLKTGFQVLPEFIICQHVRNIQVLQSLKSYFNTGVVRAESSRKDETGRQYRVRNTSHLRTTIIPFFEKHPLKTTKRIDFVKFRYILTLMERGVHLTPEGIDKIRKIRDTMNSKKLR
jgi:hypothetical protein